MSELHFFISGSIAFGSWVAGAFFFRFWKRTNDRLFLYFGLAFWLFALGRVVSALSHSPDEEAEPVYYLIRLIAFILIIIAVIDKNRATKT